MGEEKLWPYFLIYLKGKGTSIITEGSEKADTVI